MPSICTKPLTAGDVIFELKPLIHVLETEFKSDFCANCAEGLKKLKRCSKCLQLSYCDKRCQTIDWKYHKNECKVFRSKAFDPKQSSSKEQIFLRIWFCIKSDKTFAIKRHQLFDGSDVSLNDIIDRVEGLDKRELFMAEFEVFLQHFADYGLDFDRKELLNCYKIFATNCLVFKKIVVCNQLNPVNCIGFGLYLQLSHISHSCIPNSAVVNIKGLSLQLRAMKSIGFGEELTISYIPLGQDKDDRQMELMVDYTVDCKCDKCVNNPDLEVDYELIGVIDRLKQYDLWGFGADVLFGLMSKLIESYDTIYGQYNSIKTTNLLLLLDLCVKTNFPNKEFVNQLMTKIQDYIPITHGESHEINVFFESRRRHYSSDVLLNP